MSTPTQELIALEKKFWQSIVDQDAKTATDMLCEPALMVSSHGAMKFDHASYAQMAEQGPMVLTAFELSDFNVVFPNDDTAILTYRVKQSTAPRGAKKATQQEMNDSSTWVRTGAGWQCAVHTETPAQEAGAKKH